MRSRPDDFMKSLYPLQSVVRLINTCFFKHVAGGVPYQEFRLLSISENEDDDVTEYARSRDCF